MQRVQSSLHLCGILMLILVFVASGQDKRPMTLIDLLNVPSLRDAQLSPDGQQVLYVLSKADWDANKNISHIWRANVAGTGSIQMTNGQDGEASPRWSPDGQWIAFLAKRGDDEKAQIYLIRNEGGEAHRLTEHETSVTNITWAPGGEIIYFQASDPKTEEEKQRDKVNDDVFAFDENYKQRHLWMISVEQKEEQRITEGDYSVLNYHISRDGQTIVMNRAPTPLYDNSDEADVWIMDIGGKEEIRLTKNTISEGGARISPDKTQVLFTAGANEKFETYYNRNLFLVSAKGGKSVPLFPDFPYQIQQARWGHDTSTIYALVNMGVHSELFKIDVTTKRYIQLTDGNHSLGNWQYNHNLRQHVFSINQADNAGDIWTFQDGDREPVQITRVFDYLAEEFHLPRQEKISYKGKDGVTVEGTPLLPHWISGRKALSVGRTDAWRTCFFG